MGRYVTVLGVAFGNHAKIPQPVGPTQSFPRRNQIKSRFLSTHPIRMPHRLSLTYWYCLCYAANVFRKRTTSLAASLLNRRTNLLDHPFFTRNPVRMTSSEKRHLNPFRINSSGDKDLKSFRINTSKKHPGVGGYRTLPCISFFDARPNRSRPVVATGKCGILLMHATHNRFAEAGGHHGK
jgi:hypothetical protein